MMVITCSFLYHFDWILFHIEAKQCYVVKIFMQIVIMFSIQSVPKISVYICDLTMTNVLNQYDPYYINFLGHPV